MTWLYVAGTVVVTLVVVAVVFVVGFILAVNWMCREILRSLW